MNLPCSTCNGDCCGPVPLSESRLNAIRALIAEWPRKEKKRMARQQRDGLLCKFYDVENHRCSVYEQRPVLCRLYGRVEGLQCPHVQGLVQIESTVIAQERLRAEGASGVVMLSTDFKWKEVL